MIVTIVSVSVVKEHINDFINASIENHKNSVLEPGNLRFDILQNESNPELFTLYEAYDSVESSKAHKETAHYLKWRDTVADWMAFPRKGVSHSVVAPNTNEGWKK